MLDYYCGTGRFNRLPFGLLHTVGSLAHVTPKPHLIPFDIMIPTVGGKIGRYNYPRNVTNWRVETEGVASLTLPFIGDCIPHLA